MSSGGSALHAGLAPSQACACDQTGVRRSGSPPTPGRALVEKSQNTHTLSPRAGTVGREAVFSLSHPLPTLLTSCRSVCCLHSQACPATAWPALSPAVWVDRVTAAGLQHPEGRWGVRAAHGVSRQAPPPAGTQPCGTERCPRPWALPATLRMRADCHPVFQELLASLSRGVCHAPQATLRSS